jgi:hypothetical protein
MIDMPNELTVADVLNVPREARYLTMIRSIAPAIVIVLEKDAPARMQFLRTTEEEEDTLAEWARGDQLAARVLDAYFGDDEEDSERWEREDDHAARLEAGERLDSLRLTIYEQGGPTNDQR